MKKSVLFAGMLLIVTAGLGQGRYEIVLNAIALSERGRQDEAVNILTSGIQIEADAGLYLLRAEIYLKGNNVSAAVSDFMTAENLSQGSGLFGLAKCASARGDARSATAYLEAHLKTSFKKSEPEIMLDPGFASVSSSPEWRSLWKKEWYKNYERKKWEIEHYIKIGRPDMASETWQSLNAEYTEMPVTEYCEAILANAEGRYREALVILTSLSEGTAVPPEYLLALADAYAGNGDFYAAASTYGRLIRTEYADPGIFLLRAEMLMQASDNEAALKDLERYLIYFPDDFKALSLTGKILANQGSIYDALPYLNHNIELHPGKAQAFILRGDAWFASRTWDKAVEDYSMSLDLDPANGVVNQKLGIALLNCGKTEDACHYFRKAMDLGEKGSAQYIGRYCIK